MSVTGRPSSAASLFSAATPCCASIAAVNAASQARSRSAAVKIASVAVADQLEHVAAVIVNGRDDHVGVIVEQRDDLFRVRCR